MITFFDSHAHLNHHQFQDDMDRVVKSAQEAGVTHILNVGYDLQSSRQAVELAERYEHMYAAVGVHPHDASDYSEAIEAELELLGKRDKVVAIGEIGLDYYRNLSPRDQQKDTLRRQIGLAKKLGKPIIIHNRDSHQDILELLQAEKASELGVLLHCFSGSAEMAATCVKLGWYLSLAGPVTYPNAKKPVRVGETIPMDRLLIETDCPYLAPQPVRGKRNEPAYVPYVAEKIAAIRQVPIREIAERTFHNTKRFFRIK